MDTLMDISLLRSSGTGFSSKTELAGVHDACRVQGRLNSAQGVQSRPVLGAHVRRELEADAVVVVHPPPRREHGGDAVLPDLVVQRERVLAAVRDQEARVD